MQPFESKPPSAKPKGIPTVILAIGGAILGLVLAVAIFFASGMANPKPAATRLKEPEVPKDTPAAKAKLNARKTEQASSKFESSLKEALSKGNIAVATRLARTKEQGMTGAFLDMCRQMAADSKAGTRAAVAAALGAHLAEKPVEDTDLLKFLDDRDRQVVLACVESLEAMKPCPIAYVQKGFEVAAKADSGKEVRERIAAWLRGMTPLTPTLVPVFTREAGSKVAEIRQVVAEALAQAPLENKAGLEIARKFVADDNPIVASAGIRMIARYRQGNRAESLGALLRALDSKNPEIQSVANKEILGLGKPNPEDLTPLTNALGEGGERSRARACALLGTLGPDASPALSDLARLAKAAASPSVAAAALAAMGMMGKAAETELAVVRDSCISSQASIRAAALVAMAKISRDGMALAALFEAVADPDPLVSKAAGEGLDSLTPPLGSADDIKILESMLKGKTGPVRAKVFAIAAAIGPAAKALAPHALQALDDPDPLVMSKAALALMSQPERQSATIARMQATLFSALSNPAKEKLVLGILEFYSLAGPDAVPAIPALRRVLGPEQRSAAVVSAALKAAGSLGKGGVPLIPDMLNHVGEPANPPTDTIDNFTGAFLKARHNQAVVDAIAAMGSAAVPDMEKLIARPQIGARFFALLVFEKMGEAAKSAMPVITKLAAANGDPSALVNATAVRVREAIAAAGRK